MSNTLLVCLYSDAVFYSAGQEEKILKLQSFILLQDVAFDLLQLLFKPVNQLMSPPLSEVLVRVMTQRNLGRRKCSESYCMMCNKTDGVRTSSTQSNMQTVQQL